MPSSGVQTCALDRKSTRLNSSHTIISYAVFCLKKKNFLFVIVFFNLFVFLFRISSFYSFFLPVLHFSVVLFFFLLQKIRSHLILFFFFNFPAPPEFFPFPHHGPLPI